MNAGDHLRFERLIVQTLLLLHDFCGSEVHLTLQLLQLLPQPMRCDCMMLCHRLVEPRHRSVRVSFESCHRCLQTTYRRTRTLARVVDGVGGEGCGDGHRVAAGEEPHDASHAVW